MTGRTHLVGGAAAASAAIAITMPSYAGAAMLLGGGLLGGLLPDIDKRGSKISNRFPLVNSFVSVFFTHRGLLHDITFYATLALLVFPAWRAGGYPAFILGLFLGIFSHLFLDGLNGRGVPVFLFDALRFLRTGRFKQRRYRLLKLKTGSFSETIVCILLFILILGAICFAGTDYWSQFLASI